MRKNFQKEKKLVQNRGLLKTKDYRLYTYKYTHIYIFTNYKLYLLSEIILKTSPSESLFRYFFSVALPLSSADIKKLSVSFNTKTLGYNFHFHS